MIEKKKPSKFVSLLFSGLLIVAILFLLVGGNFAFFPYPLGLILVSFFLLGFVAGVLALSLVFWKGKSLLEGKPWLRYMALFIFSLGLIWEVSFLIYSLAISEEFPWWLLVQIIGSVYLLHYFWIGKGKHAFD